MSKLTDTAKTELLCHHALKYRMSLATPLATVLTIDKAANDVTSYPCPRVKTLTLSHQNVTFYLFLSPDFTRGHG